MLQAYGLNFKLHHSIIDHNHRYWAAETPVRMKFNSVTGQHIIAKAGQYIVIEESSGFHFTLSNKIFNRVYHPRVNRENTTPIYMESPDAY